MVLSRRFPHAEIRDDVQTVGKHNLAPVDVICGGFPCQDVSVAGKREGLGGMRTGLFWEVVRIARELQPRWMVLENVPGLLSSHGGRDFHAVLSALANLGFRRAYRILDSQYFGVPQRRRRVFLVLRARGDGADAVLFESEGGGRHSQTGEASRQSLAATLRGRSHGAGVNAPGRGGEDDQKLVTGPLGGGAYGTGRRTEDDPNLVSATLQSNSGRNHIEDTYIALGVHANQLGELRTSALAGSLNGSRSGKQYEGVFATLNSGGNEGGFRTEPGEHLEVPERARALVGSMFKRHDDDTDTLIPTTAHTLTANYGKQLDNSDRNGGPPNLINSVRRLTPLECERLQGFPDGWTCLCGEGHRGSQFCSCPDSPRYKQIGNAVTVPVAEWIARRILEAESVSL